MGGCSTLHGPAQLYPVRCFACDVCEVFFVPICTIHMAMCGWQSDREGCGGSWKSGQKGQRTIASGPTDIYLLDMLTKPCFVDLMGVVCCPHRMANMAWVYPIPPIYPLFLKEGGRGREQHCVCGMHFFFKVVCLASEYLVRGLFATCACLPRLVHGHWGSLVRLFLRCGDHITHCSFHMKLRLKLVRICV